MEGEKTDDDQLSFLFLNSYGIKKLKFRITRSHFLNNLFPAARIWHAKSISIQKYVYVHLSPLVVQWKYKNENSQGILEKCAVATHTLHNKH